MNSQACVLRSHCSVTDTLGACTILDCPGGTQEPLLITYTAGGTPTQPRLPTGASCCEPTPAGVLLHHTAQPASLQAGVSHIL